MMATLKGLLGSQVVWMAVIVATLFGLWKWEASKVKAAKLEIEGIRKSLVMASTELQDAADINKGALDQLAAQAAEVERQKRLAAETKAKERLAWSRVNKLKQDIQNVTENPPVPLPIELFLDRVRGTVPGPGPAASGPDQGGNAETTPVDRPVVSDTANASPETPR